MGATVACDTADLARVLQGHQVAMNIRGQAWPADEMPCGMAFKEFKHRRHVRWCPATEEPAAVVVDLRDDGRQLLC
ncbi:hypothetical protein A7R75_23240 [Mycolicibacterium llatzerense]|nr:hypothetical protein [Mycolicibacterium llatzerense]